jgi:transcriptional regulator with XRE-family HTH domain
MPMNEAIKYLRELRMARDITQSQVARAADVESKQVSRWERGESEPTASSLAAYIAVVGASPQDVQELISDQSATVDEAIALAKRHLAAGQEGQQTSPVPTFSKMTRDHLDDLIEANDPEELKEVVAYLRKDATVLHAFRAFLDAFFRASEQNADQPRPEATPPPKS